MKVPAHFPIAANVDFQASAAPAEGEPAPLPHFVIEAYSGDRMRPAGYPVDVVVDVAGVTVPPKARPVLAQHQNTVKEAIGHTTSVDAADGRIVAHGVVSSVTEAATSVVAAARNGFPWQASVGMTVEKLERIQAGQSVRVNGREFTGPLAVARRATLREISFVPLGADDNTSARLAATLSVEGPKDMNEFEKWISAKGFDADSLGADQKATLQAAFDAEKNPVDVATIVAAERERISRIDAALEGLDADTVTDLRAKAVAGELDDAGLGKAILAAVRNSRPKAPAAHVATGSPDTRVLEAALCINNNLPAEIVAASYGEEVANRASAGNMRGVGLQALLRQSLAAAGKSLSPFTAPDEMIRAAFEADRELRASGVSNYSIGGVLSNIANKFIVAGFNATEQAWRQVATVASVNDFKTKTTYRMTGDGMYEELAPDGQIRHATIGETSYTNRVKTYAKMLGVTRTDIRNDDLGAVLNQARQVIGSGAGRKINDVFWREFMDNSSFFTTGRKNYFEGASTNLSVASIATAEKMFLDQTDEDGQPTGIEPTTLLVSTTEYNNATLLMTANEVRSTEALSSGGSKYPTKNPHVGKYNVVFSRFLANASYTGNSAVAWYLLASPGAAGVGLIEIAFLDGKQTPTVEQSDLDFNMLGIQMRGFHDFGVAKQEYRCGVKSKGAA